MKIHLPNSAYNWISLIGATIASISFFMIVFLFSITVIFEQQSSYIGLIIYILLPAFLILGLLLIPIGMHFKRKKTLKEKTDPNVLPILDLNNLRHRNGFMIFGIGTIIFLFVSAVGSYEMFHYSESVEFCGTICHSVMKPEYVAYQNSPHARVACVQCHVGEGADWYMRSKLSGMYQVYAVTMGNYPRPIPTPIKNLRPARETCERCHWPEKFYSRKLRVEKHFLQDEENTEWNINLIMKIGAEHNTGGLDEGIHWHINSDILVEYRAIDEQLQEIPWVRYTDKISGEQKIYKDSEISDEEINKLEIRKMDCMDCHNRPSHRYNSPNTFINNAMASNKISKEIPEIKTAAIEALSNEYSTEDSLNQNVRKSILDFYTDNYPEVLNNKKNELNRSIDEILVAANKNIFPEMKVRWDKYPMNIGHMEFNGCFRCHNEILQTKEEQVISRDCNLCHIINAQGTPDEFERTTSGEALVFKHPVDIDEEWKETFCSECHNE